MAEPKTRPILFSGPMVRAILDGRKTQTRRIVNPKSVCVDWEHVSVGDRCYDHASHAYGIPGDRLWVRETWAVNHGTAGGHVYRADHGIAQCVYEAEHNTGDWRVAVSRWKPSIFMPRAASRITLEINDVRVERLQQISDVDSLTEGCSAFDMKHGDSLTSVYARLWETINGAGSWAVNPWVWVVSFRVIKPAAGEPAPND
jgi:hypothetical protein